MVKINTFNKIIVILCGLIINISFANAHKMLYESSPIYQEECGGCHLAFPPTLLLPKDWRTIMQSLDKHYGESAELENNIAQEITDYLVKNSINSKQKRKNRLNQVNVKKNELPRLTKTGWFIHEHDEVKSRVWSNPEVKTAANCEACHIQAEQGDYDEDNIRIPK